MDAHVKLLTLKRIGIAVLVGSAFTYGFAAAYFRICPYFAIRDASVGTRALVTEVRQRFGDAASEQSLDDETRAQLEALGYLQGYQPAPEESGIVVHERDRSFQGLNLYVSAHAPAAFLMDMDGEILHEWRYDYERACPEHFDPDSPHQAGWGRARALDNGDVVALFHYNALIRVDKDSRLIWALCEPYHHDIAIGEDGLITTIRTDPRTDPRISGRHEFQDDAIAILQPDGKLSKRISIFDALMASPYASHLRLVDEENLAETGDIFHNNAVKLIDGRNAHKLAALKAGNLMISIRELDTVAILDPEQEKIVWALSGMWQRQHEPVPLDNGNFLVFDNQSGPDWSNVFEVDPTNQEIAWSYRGDEQNRFRSTCCGTNQRLPNGNTLVTSSEQGTAFEVTPDNEIVWKFVNPARLDDGDLIATLFDLRRLADDESPDWLRAPTARGSKAREGGKHESPPPDPGRRERKVSTGSVTTTVTLAGPQAIAPKR